MSPNANAPMTFNMANQQHATKGISSLQVRQTLLAQQRVKQRQRLLQEQHAANQQPAQQQTAGGAQQAFRQFSPPGGYAHVSSPDLLYYTVQTVRINYSTNFLQGD